MALFRVFQMIDAPKNSIYPFHWIFVTGSKAGAILGAGSFSFTNLTACVLLDPLSFLWETFSRSVSGSPLPQLSEPSMTLAVQVGDHLLSAHRWQDEGVNEIELNKAQEIVFGQETHS